MNRRDFLAATPAALALAGFARAQPPAAPGLSLRVMTFNIRYGTAKDGDNHWDRRKDFLVDVIRQEAPDVLGLQEALHSQIAYILQAIPGYAMVGVGRDLSPDTGTGGELYTIIGHAPRQLDRNIALVGRIVSGIEHMSSLPRGTEALGFYKERSSDVPIVSARMATELPAADRPRFE